MASDDPLASASAEKPVVLKSTMAQLSFYALVVVCAVALGDSLVRGRLDVALAALPTLAFVVWIGVVVFLRPSVRLDASGITVVNILRTAHIAWDQVADVTTRYQLVIETRDGGQFKSWGAPVAKPWRGRLQQMSQKPNSSAALRDVVDGFMTRYRAGSAEVEPVEWHPQWTAIVTGVVFVVALAIQSAVSGL